MNRYSAFGIASAILLAAVIIFSVSYVWIPHPSKSSQATGTYTQQELDAVNVTSGGITVLAQESSIYINSSSVLPVMMGPMNAPNMYSFEILSLINPHIQVKAGVAVQFTVVNIDSDSYHNFVISSEGPPYPYMMGGGMMSGYYYTMMPYLPPAGSGSYSYTNFTVSFSHSGNFWYLCTYPGHAEQGMYGEITVS